MAASGNVAAEYALSLSVGSVDPATELPKFLEKLKANGMDEVMTEVNGQLDAFMAAKGE